MTWQNWPNLRKPVALLAAVCFMLSSCSNLDRDYRLRFWENCRIASEQALHKHDLRLAGTMAEEAVYQAQGFGDSDFRLGVSLCDLGDVFKVKAKNKESEDSYKRAVAVLEAAAIKGVSIQAASAGVSGETRKETDKLLRRLAREDLANTLSHLADLYAMQERNQDASHCFEKAAGIYQSMLGGNQWSVDDSPMGQEHVQCLLGLAQVSIALKNYDTADSAFKDALRIAVASNSPEFMLREIRDSYLKLLTQLGRTSQAKKLIADELFSKFSSEGAKAMALENYPVAEAYFRKAYFAAQQSIFSERRLMRSLFNLQSIFTLEQKFADMEKTFNQAREFMKLRGLRFDRDFDLMLSTQIMYYLQTNRAAQAIPALEQQLQYRIRHYGADSMQICETLALKGKAELQSRNIQAADRLAGAVYRIILAKHLSNRRAVNAMNETSELMMDLNHFEEAEVLTKHVADLDLKLVAAGDPRTIGHETNLFALYFRFHKQDKALKLVNNIVATLMKSDTNQRIQAMPYLVLIQAYSLARNWYDVANPITELGQSILQEDLGGAPLSAMGQSSWKTGLDKMEQHFSRKFS